MDVIGHPNYTIHEDGRVWNKLRKQFMKQTLSDGYLLVQLDGRLYKLHRLIAQHYIPNPDNKRCIDHIDRNRSNNTITNLRWATYQENSINKNRREDVNIVVRPDLTNRPFQVRINRHNTPHYIGCYATIEEARAARDEWLATH